MRKENILKDTCLGEKTRLKLRGLVTNRECIYIILLIYWVCVSGEGLSRGRAMQSTREPC